MPEVDFGAMPRLRVRYVKQGRLAFLGHLEVLHTLDRAIRRSGLPFAVGKGFARHMKVQFCQALPVGASSEAEYFDLRLTQRLDADEALAALGSVTPRDLRPVRAAYVDPKLPALEAWLDRQSWVLRLAKGAEAYDARRIEEEIEGLRAEHELHFMRGDKPRVVSLDDTLVAYELKEDGGDVTMSLETRSTGRGALRPHILLDAALERAGYAQTYARVTRLAQHHEAGAALVEPYEASAQTALT